MIVERGNSLQDTCLKLYRPAAADGAGGAIAEAGTPGRTRRTCAPTACAGFLALGSPAGTTHGWRNRITNPIPFLQAHLSDTFPPPRSFTGAGSSGLRPFQLTRPALIATCSELSGRCACDPKPAMRPMGMPWAVWIGKALTVGSLRRDLPQTPSIRGVEPRRLGPDQQRGLALKGSRQGRGTVAPDPCAGPYVVVRSEAARVWSQGPGSFQ